MFSMCSELTPRAPIPDTRIPQLMQPCTVLCSNQPIRNTSEDTIWADRKAFACTMAKHIKFYRSKNIYNYKYLQFQIFTITNICNNKYLQLQIFTITNIDNYKNLQLQIITIENIYNYKYLQLQIQLLQLQLQYLQLQLQYLQLQIFTITITITATFHASSV